MTADEALALADKAWAEARSYDLLACQSTTTDPFDPAHPVAKPIKLRQLHATLAAASSTQALGFTLRALVERIAEDS